ncbi:MAG: sigma 54-interacting transcriptional regulator [Gracilibacteraceae bacterium]|jgi:transcriptional regulator with PAS, ATPase and Fis domain|nr:sigma 54-interacting transcriptional regulator [Gracilibacteraceae bacterium]
MKEIGIIVNSTDMFRLAAEAADPEHVEVVLTHTYEESLSWARSMEKSGFRLLISRGGHSSRLREAGLSLPVVDIPFTGNNVVALLLQAKKQYPAFGVVGNRSLLQIAQAMEDSIGCGARYYEVEGWGDFELRIAEAKAAGLEAIVGGYDATSFATRAGLTGLCVTSNAYEIRTALQEAAKVLAILDEEKQRSAVFRATLDAIHEGIILLDSRGSVIHFNRTAEKLLSLDAPLAIGAPLADPALNKKIWGVLRDGAPLADDVGMAQDYRYTSSISPIRVDGQNTGAVVVLQEVGYVRKIEQIVRRKSADRGLVARNTFANIQGGSSRAMREVIRIAKHYSQIDSTVLINGESGAGKELFAQSIHNHSPRSQEAFVAVNCASIPANLLESELFGYAEGAFTGAKKGGKIGLFELAHGGTIFLDEIAEISRDMQPRLLRVLEERQIMRIGADRVIPVNTRVIAATNQNLLSLVNEGRFRSDLYYRLNVLALNLPPLRERREDTAALLEYFLRQFTQGSFGQVQLKEDGLAVLLAYPWPGNVRELKNTMERLAVVYGDRQPVGRAEALACLDNTGAPAKAERQPAQESTALGALKKQLEEQAIRQAMQEAGGNKAKAARELGITRVTLYKKLRQLELNLLINN